VGRLKEYRRIATRYDKLAAIYLAFVQLAASRASGSPPKPPRRGGRRYNVAGPATK
jgi:hypothetical protein